MIVCAHGDVEKYCAEHGMVICGNHVGNIEEYEGVCPVLVTDAKMGENEFYGLKLRMLRRGVELISVWHSDSEKADLVAYLAKNDKRQKYGGRRKFGVSSEGEKAVVQRILELRKAGATLKQISEDENVSYLDGRRMSISTIQMIIKNNEKV